MKVIKSTCVAVQYLNQWREAVDAVKKYENQGRPKARSIHRTGIMVYAEYLGNHYHEINIREHTKSVIDRLDDLAEEFNSVPVVNMNSIVARLYYKQAEEIAYGRAFDCWAA